jgi:CHAT domain-containing protein
MPSSKQAMAIEPVHGFIGFAPVFADEEGALDLWLSKAAGYVKSLLNFRSVTVDGKKFNALKYSEDEVKAIAALFDRKNSSGLGFYHGDASEVNFKANAGRHKYVHVATHGLIHEEKPELSGLIFARPEDSSSSEDGILYSAECYNLDLDADLVVLSSCESGAGQLLRGEGLLVLARGFLYSGARNIVHSLWKIDDKHTSQLMVELYKNILEGRNYPQALRQAKLKLIENEATAFPASWSSFVLIGG